MRSNHTRPVTQADIERLYADPHALPVELSSELVEHHVQRGRRLRSQESARLFKSAAAGLWRLVGFGGRHSSGTLKPARV